ncbi:MAG TPA: HepT-like ribonuclease domain-containing protein [Thermodesulfovibrionales bacterium]|nr:HepT-like ribonuclease domain-containing protein [Thermodesulfovibrionales bacterium]
MSEDRYFGVDLDIVWQTIEEDLESLDKTVKRIVSEI